jgi:hypothetical protein
MAARIQRPLKVTEFNANGTGGSAMSSVKLTTVQVTRLPL